MGWDGLGCAGMSWDKLRWAGVAGMDWRQKM
jgi:hypothetical protein